MLQLQIEHCLRENADAVLQILETTAPLSVTLTDEHDDAIFEPEIGTTPLWPSLIIQALYLDEDNAHTAQQLISLGFSDCICSIEEVPEKDWERVSVADFKPQHFGERLSIYPSWITPPPTDTAHIILDPGLAFGTGAHPTTSLCLDWLAHADIAQKTIIDFGCGSGILTLAALKLGASHVHAVDIDPQALQATQSNADINGIPQSQLTVSLPNELKQKSELIIANILLSPLISLRHSFHQLLTEEGILVVSGLLESQVQELITAYQPLFQYETSAIKEGWAQLVFFKQP